jgi:renalase
MKIAIIGAGISGLACAQALNQHFEHFQNRGGLNQGGHITIFEKSRGPSGRASTRKADTWQADHGAQYFTARSNEFNAQVQAWIKQGVVSPWKGRIRVLQDQLPTDQAPLDQFPAGLAPSESVTRYVGSPTMTAPAQAMAAGQNLQTNTTVNNLRQVDQGWQIHSQEEGWLSPLFDLVVFSIPQPQLAPFAGFFSQSVASAMHSVQFHACHAVMLQYSKALDLGFDGLFANQQAVSWVSRNNSKPGRSGQESWVVHFSAGYSQQHLEAPPEDTIALAGQFMQARGAPAQAGATLHRWRYALAEPSLTQGVLIDAQQRIIICGDWLAGGRIEGAWKSGNAAAQAVCEIIKKTA